MSYGIIHLRDRPRKMVRAQEREEQRGGRKSRRIGVNVFVQRGDKVTDYSRIHGFWAWACTAKHPASGSTRDLPGLAEKRRKTCGEDSFGRTPTAALKGALVALGRKKEFK